MKGETERNRKKNIKTNANKRQIREIQRPTKRRRKKHTAIVYDICNKYEERRVEFIRDARTKIK